MREGLDRSRVWKLLGAPDNVMAKCFPQFGHNYNQVSREVMYNWFNKHLGLGQKAPVEEQPFEPVPPKELSVFNDEHPLPKDAIDVLELRRRLTAEANQQLEQLLPAGPARRVAGQHAKGGEQHREDQAVAHQVEPEAQRGMGAGIVMAVVGGVCRSMCSVVRGVGARMVQGRR